MALRYSRARGSAGRLERHDDTAQLRTVTLTDPLPRLPAIAGGGRGLLEAQRHVDAERDPDATGYARERPQSVRPERAAEPSCGRLGEVARVRSRPGEAGEYRTARADSRGSLPAAPLTVGEYTLVNSPIVEFGYLTVTVDMTGRDHHLQIAFNDRTNTHTHDTVRLNLKTGRILAH